MSVFSSCRPSSFVLPIALGGMMTLGSILAADAFQKPIHSPQMVLSSSTVFFDQIENENRLGETFTYQGVLSDASGNPVAGPVGINIEYVAIRNGSEIIVSSTDLPSLSLSSNGAFSVDLPLPNAEAMSLYTFQFLRVTELGSGDTIAAQIPISATPRAWHAQFATRAKEAETAEEAAHADYADEAANALFAIRAQQMLDDETTDLFLQAPYMNFPAEYATAKARLTNGTVYLSGFIQTNGPFDSNLIATLPENMRPAMREIFWAYFDIGNSTQQRRRIDVYPNGEIRVSTDNHPGNISLSGIVFQAAE